MAGALVLDEVARREKLEVSEAEADQGIRRYAERTGRTPVAVRGGAQKEGGLSRVTRDRAGRSRLTTSWRVLQSRASNIPAR